MKICKNEYEGTCKDYCLVKTGLGTCRDYQEMEVPETPNAQSTRHTDSDLEIELKK